MGILKDLNGKSLSEKSKYAVYLDEEGNCIGVEDLWNIKREVVLMNLQTGGEPAPEVKTEPIFQIKVQARPSADPKMKWKEYNTCYKFGRCYSC